MHQARTQIRFMRPLTVALTSVAAVASSGSAAITPSPSSHREAPFVAGRPQIDGTDFYMFTSYESGKEDMVVLVANYLPLQDPYGGPNYFALDPNARYDIHIDNDGDAVEDLTFRFGFRNRLRDLALPVGDPGAEKIVSVPLVNIGPIAPGAEDALNVFEAFSVDLIEGDLSGLTTTVTPVTKVGSGSPWFRKPVDNIGTKSIPDYSAYADSFIYDINLPGGATGRMFVGQRKDPFVVNLGETFDLVNTNPLGPVDGETDDLADKNVTSLILELPKSYLAPGSQQIIGGWTTARLPRTVSLSPDPGFYTPGAIGAGEDLVQVSRLGMPLVNEVVIGLPDKNRFNASRPLDDGQFLDYVQHPTLPELLEILFGVQAPDFFPRQDLLATFVTGLNGLNQNGSVGEMLRLNLDVAPTPASAQSNLGVIGGDNAGYPNGRRPGDDVVDISLRVVMGVLLDPAIAPDGQLPFTDGAIVDASYFDVSFPFLRDPLPGAPQ